jgi:hypothetical protein
MSDKWSLRVEVHIEDDEIVGVSVADADSPYPVTPNLSIAIMLDSVQYIIESLLGQGETLQ